MNNGFVDRFNKMVDTLLLSFLWIVCCVPVVTVGAATCGLYYAYHKGIRQDNGHPYRAYFAAFKANFLRATGIWLAVFVFLGLSLFTCYCLVAMRGMIPMAGIFSAMGNVIVGFVIMWSLYLFPYLSRFENTAGNAMKNSAILTVANLLWSLLLLLLLAVGVILFVMKPFLLVVLVGVYLWVANLILERIFRRLMTTEERVLEMQLD